MERGLTQFVDKILRNDSTGCDEVDNYFATDAETMVQNLCEYDFDED